MVKKTTKICNLCEKKNASFIIEFTEETWNACPECVAISFENEPEEIISVKKLGFK